MQAVDLVPCITSPHWTRFQKLFPDFFAFASEVEIIPWNTEYEQNDTENAQAIAWAWKDKKQIAFKEIPPSFSVFVHELGHIYFQESDPIWGALYAGGELLVEVALKHNFTTNEQTVRRLHALFHEAFLNPNEVAKEIAATIVSTLNFQCFPHIFRLQTYAGSLPLRFEDYPLSLFADPLFPIDVEANYSDVRSFFAFLLTGLQYYDTYALSYAKALQLIFPCPDCHNLICKCPT